LHAEPFGVCSSSQIAYMPLAYISQYELVLGLISDGGRVCLSSGNPSTFFQEIPAASPTFFQAPPRVWTALYTEYSRRLAEYCTCER
jgi:long-subunit acyl-CoA synthetase (AMP-forming)